MLKNKSEKSGQHPALRLWPGLIIVSLQWILWLIIPLFYPEAYVYGVFAGLLGGIAIIIWWGFFSRAPWIERLAAVVIIILGLLSGLQISHASIATGYQGLMFFVYAIPPLCLVFIIWALLSKYFSDRVRRITMGTSIIIACTFWALLRSEGITSDGRGQFVWRWKMTTEEELVADDYEDSDLSTSLPLKFEGKAEWPGFRGSNRNAIIHHTRIKTDWSDSPPIELWRRPIGPGCSSFAIHGDYFFTQEQRGEDEVVSCYRLDSGEPAWMHYDPVRFWDSHAGAGPRSTPTLSDSFVYTLGATGILNALKACDGSLVWARNVASDTDTKDSGWGFTSSPLVIDELIVVAATGKLAAYDRINGNPRWFSTDTTDSYSSPHLAEIENVRQILIMNGSGVSGYSPADGKMLWRYLLPCETRIIQPAILDKGDILISAGERRGVHRLNIRKNIAGWQVKEQWISARLRPDFNDFVIHKKHIYGFDGARLVCIDLQLGKRIWKGKSYGGQLLLLADQDILLILSEKGELILVEASPLKFNELSRIAALERKTWNHPVLVKDILLVRNSVEMVAYRLSRSGI
jgi:outer membrane protein assembly factor BamB